MPEIVVEKKRPSEEENIKLLSHEVRDIISQKPGWIVSNGILVFLAVIVLLLTLTFFIRFPDTVTANAKLTSVNAPKEIKARTDGLLIKMLAKEGQLVGQDEVIGFMESRSTPAEIMALSDALDSLRITVATDAEQPARYALPAYTHLGEVQPLYQVFTQAMTIYRQYLSSGFYLHKKKMLDHDMADLQRLHQTLAQQRTIQQEDLKLAAQTYEANQALNKNKAISEFEYRAEKSKYLSKAMSIPQINASLISNESSRHEKEKEQAQLENDIAQQKGIFMQALNTLKAGLDDWKSKYLLMAPVAGKVAFASIIQENTQITHGQTICYINPADAQFYATVLIPQSNFGKISIGKRALLRLPAYPYQEFGTLKGTLAFVSSIPTDSGFMAKIILPQGLTTSYKRQLQYREGLSAQAEIITEDLKLSDRLFHELKSLIKNRK